ncbi:MAG: hypothetical protein OEW11_03940 [Nitrospirota bacterium]|nr:hypothetical protein [Nitrospirota bacterium]
MKALWIPELILLAAVATGCTTKPGMMMDDPMPANMSGNSMEMPMTDAATSGGMSGGNMSGDGMMMDGK